MGIGALASEQPGQQRYTREGARGYLIQPGPVVQEGDFRATRGVIDVGRRTVHALVGHDHHRLAVKWAGDVCGVFRADPATPVARRAATLGLG